MPSTSGSSSLAFLGILVPFTSGSSSSAFLGILVPSTSGFSSLAFLGILVPSTSGSSSFLQLFDLSKKGVCLMVSDVSENHNAFIVSVKPSRKFRSCFAPKVKLRYNDTA